MSYEPPTLDPLTRKLRRFFFLDLNAYLHALSCTVDCVDLAQAISKVGVTLTNQIDF